MKEEKYNASGIHPERIYTVKLQRLLKVSRTVLLDSIVLLTLLYLFSSENITILSQWVFYLMIQYFNNVLIWYLQA